VQDLNERHTAVLLTVEEMQFDKEMQKGTAEKVQHLADLEQDVRASAQLMLSELKACRDAVHAELQSVHLSAEVAARSQRERNELGDRLRQVCRPFFSRCLSLCREACARKQRCIANRSLTHELIMQSETQILDLSHQLGIAKATALSRQKRIEVQLAEEQERSKKLGDQVAEVPHCPHPVFSTLFFLEPTHHGVLRVLKGSC
jgi:hypothetical protein